MNGALGGTGVGLPERDPRGMLERLQILEGLVNELSDYQAELVRFYNQRCSNCEQHIHGTNRPEPYMPSFPEWYEKRHQDRVAQGPSGPVPTKEWRG